MFSVSEAFLAMVGLILTNRQPITVYLTERHISIVLGYRWQRRTVEGRIVTLEDLARELRHPAELP